MTAYERVVDALREHGSNVNDDQSKAMAQCPAHDDQRASLSIGPRRDGKGVVVHCHAGCDHQDVLAAIKLTPRDLFDEDSARSIFNGRRDYRYPDGRVVHRKPGKNFPQSGNTKGNSLFHSDRIGDAKTVYVPEGEKDVEAIELVGGAAVCPPMGAGQKNLDRYDWSVLRGKDVSVIADRDEAGRKHAAQVAELLHDVAASVRIMEAALGKDAADHIAAGKTLDELVEPPDDEPSVLDRMVDGAWLDAQIFPPLEYAVPGVITEGFGLLVAPPKAGKSWLVADVGLAVAAGGKALGRIDVNKRPVLYLALEDGHRRLQSRFRHLTAGAEIPKGMHVIIQATPGEAMAAIAEFLGRHACAKPLMVLDTLGKVKPPKHSGEDSYQVDYAIGSRLKSIVDSVPGATLLVVHHTRKADSADFVDSVSGTQGIAGSADFVMVLTRKRHCDEAVLSVTGRDVPEAEYALKAVDGMLWRLDGETLEAAAKKVTERRDDASLARLGDRALEVLAFVNSSAAHTAPAAVAEKFGIDNKSAGQYLSRLAEQGRIGKAGRGSYHSLQVPEESEESEETAGQGSISILHQSPLSEELPTGEEFGSHSEQPIPHLPHFLHPPSGTPPGAPTDRTPGMTERVQEALEKARHNGEPRPQCPCGRPSPVDPETGLCHWCSLKSSKQDGAP